MMNQSSSQEVAFTQADVNSNVQATNKSFFWVVLLNQIGLNRLKQFAARVSTEVTHLNSPLDMPDSHSDSKWTNILVYMILWCNMKKRNNMTCHTVNSGNAI